MSGFSQRRSSWERRVVKGGVPRRTVIVALPLFTDEASGEENLLRVLLDTGSDGDLFFPTRRMLKFFETKESAYPTTWGTSNGKFKTRKKACLKLLLPEFSQNKRFDLEADVKVIDDDEAVSYDLILGIETLSEFGAILDFRDNEITIDNQTIAMRGADGLADHKELRNTYMEAVEPLATKEETERVVRILDAKYEPADLPKVVEENCSHLSYHQRKDLLALLRKHEKMFQGKLGQWTGDHIKFELKPGAKPWHGRPYQVPHIHKETVEKELKRLVDIGVLERVTDSEWGSPSFIIPKTNGTVRFLTDFREVNKRIIRKPHPIPKISEMLQQMEKFQFMSSVDLNMGYYHLTLDMATREICTIVFPWGKYRYKRLPMGAACAPDLFQARMTSLFQDMEMVQCYIDDLLLVTAGTFEDHLEQLDLVLQRLGDKGFQVNAAKSHFCALELDYLGYTLSREGIAPQKKKVAAILALKPPKNVKELRRVLGIIQYYRDLWQRRTDLCAPLSDLVAECGTTKKKRKAQPWRWEAEHQEAFDKIKQVIARDVMLAYPDFTKKFVVYTDASTRQLGGVITQSNRPLAFFGRKLTKAQEKYTVTELELLSIVELLKEFKGMLLGYKVEVWTDHINLTRDNLGLDTSDRVHRWRLLLNEYDVDIKYIKGENNTVADAISRLDYCPKVNPHDEDDEAFDAAELKVEKHNARLWKDCSIIMSHLKLSEEVEESDSASEDLEPTRECWTHQVFAHQEMDEDEIFPVTISEVADAQRRDKELKNLFKKNPDKKLRKKYEHVMPLELAGEIVLCYRRKVEDRPRMFIPKELRENIIIWYHHYLQHPGQERLEETLASTMYWRGMKQAVRDFTKYCKRCQLGKKRKRKYGKLPPKTAEVVPWRTVQVDLIGPYTIKGEDGSAVEFMCMTMIDPATGWFECIELPTTPVFRLYRERDASGKPVREVEVPDEQLDKSSAQISRIFNKTWLCRYPRPKEVICDNGSEFKRDFATLLKTYNIKRKPTTSKNPQANAICERVHGVFGDMMRCAGINMSETVDAELVDEFVTNAAWAIRSSYHTVLKATPGQAIFGRDMLFDIPFVTDWAEVGRRRQQLVDCSNLRENAKRLDFDYVVGSKALIIKATDGSYLPKAEDKNEGPYEVTQVYTNGTVRLQRGSVNERINIRRLTPYFENE